MACKRALFGPALIALLGVLLAGASFAAAQTAATPPPAVEITPGDNGSTLHVVVGQGVTVRLGSTMQWQVAFDPPDVLQAVPGVNTTTRDVQAILRAARPGTTVMTAQGRPICNPGQACPQLVQQVTVTIVVAQTQPGTGVTQSASPAAGAGAAPSAVATRPAATATRATGVQLPNTGAAAGSRSGRNWIALTVLGVAALIAAVGALALRRRARG